VQDPAARGVLKEFRPDALVHCAAQTSVPRSWQDPLADADANVSGIINILEACIAASCKRVVYLSSAAVYGEPEYLPVDEEHPIMPASPYGASKYAGELYLQAYAVRYGLSGFAVRCSNVYGPRQKPGLDGGVVAAFLDAVRHGLERRTRPIVHVFGDGRQTRDFIWVSDVAGAICCGLGRASSLPGIQPLNVSTGVETSVDSLIDRVRRSVLGGVEVVYQPGRPGDLRRSSLNHDRAWRLLGWRPRMCFEDGLEISMRQVLRQTSSGACTVGDHS